MDNVIKYIRILGQTYRIASDGEISEIKIGGTSYTPEDGVITLPEYHNGSNGSSIKTISRKSGTGAAGTTDTYSVYDDNNTEIGTFTVTNGANGAQGPKGETGAQGPQGAVGPQGPKGETGAQGPKGADGTPGTNGTNGKDGYTPYIQNGYWYINGVNQNVKAVGLDGIVDYSRLNDYVSKNDLDVEALLLRISILESYHQVVQTPTFTGGNTTFADTATVTINVPTGTTVRYTTDGSEPTASSTVYSGPFTITDTTTVKAKAFDGNSASQTSSATYTKEQPVGGADPFVITLNIPTSTELSQQLDPTATKPSEYVAFSTNGLVTRPTVVHLIYPSDWNSTPTITDNNNNPVQGGSDNSTTPTITVNGRQYRVFDIRLGVDNFKIYF